MGLYNARNPDRPPLSVSSGAPLSAIAPLTIRPLTDLPVNSTRARAFLHQQESTPRAAQECRTLDLEDQRITSGIPAPPSRHVHDFDDVSLALRCSLWDLMKEKWPLFRRRARSHSQY